MIIRLIHKYAQFIKFAVIGVLNTLIHGGILTLAVEAFKADVVVANLIAFITANVFSYFMNSIVTFKAPIALLYYVKFFATSLFSLGLTLLIAWLAELYGLHYLVGFLFIIVLVPILSFFIMKFWAFSHSQTVR